MKGPDKAWNVVKKLGEALGSFPESFIKIKHLEPYHDSPFPLMPFLDLVGHGGSWQSKIKLDR